MNNFELIEQREVLGKEFKIYGSCESPMFLAKDVAEWIEHKNPTVMLKTVDADEKVLNIVYTLGGIQEAWFLTEDGLYEVLMQSRKPIAKEFKKQVKCILKEIRKNGIYATDELLNNPDLLLNAAMALKQGREKIRELENEITVLAPKAKYYDVVLSCKDLVSITLIAKDYGKTAQWLNNYLHEKGVQFRYGKVWHLYSEYAGMGYAGSRTHLYTDSDGVSHTFVHTYWTPKGRWFIYCMLKGDGILPLIEITN